jgi:hypothetical protein
MPNLPGGRKNAQTPRRHAKRPRSFRGFVTPSLYASPSMGTVIELDALRRRRPRIVEHGGLDLKPDGHEGGPVPLARLERAIGRLDPLINGGTGRIGPRVETELLAITGAVTAGRVEDAATRAERLAERLEHPSSRAAR